MDYFDNSALIEKIIETSGDAPKNEKGVNVIFVAGLILVVIAVTYFGFKTEKLKKEQKN